MHQYKKILVIGNCGSGKSIFSRKLARKLDIPLIHLDREFWKPGWITTPEDEWQEKVKQLVAHDQWIIDGNYFKSMPLRMQAADWMGLSV